MHLRTFQYLDAPAGAAKTTVTINDIHARALKGSRIVIVQRTIRLINETADRLVPLTPLLRVKVIHGEQGKRPVAEGSQ